jgi:hypothetical protein
MDYENYESDSIFEKPMLDAAKVLESETNQAVNRIHRLNRLAMV